MYEVSLIGKDKNFFSIFLIFEFLVYFYNFLGKP